MTATIHVCPICHEQADYSDDYGWAVYCSHPPYEDVEPVEVEGAVKDGRLVFVLPDPEEWKRTVGAATLDAEIERAVARINWLALSCDERVAERERQETAAGARFLLTTPMVRQLYSSLFQHMNPTIVHVCERCHDAGCENTWEEPNPDYVESGKFWSGGYTINVEPGFTYRSGPQS